MHVLVQTHVDLSVITASLCGALTWIMNQRFLDRKKQPVLFLVSFIMGILGADVTLEIIKMMMPDVFNDERAAGAFFCSALVVTLITNLMSRISLLEKTKKQ